MMKKELIFDLLDSISIIKKKKRQFVCVALFLALLTTVFFALYLLFEIILFSIISILLVIIILYLSIRVFVLERLLIKLKKEAFDEIY